MSEKMPYSPEILTQIVEQFATKGTITSIEKYGTGHINDTFLIKTQENENRDYLLQRKNHKVFKDVPAMMENIDRVTHHIREKMGDKNEAAAARNVLTVVPTSTGGLYYKDENGNYWTVFIFIAGSKSYDIVTDPAIAREGGRAFGRFHQLLSDFPPPPLHETIPNFHNIDMRLDTFHQIMAKNPAGRLKEAEAEVRQLDDRAKTMSGYWRKAMKEMPQRITHNDTKFNNLLFDEANKAFCVIDLDTVMPGLIIYDFGDSIRTVTNTGAEDDPNLDNIHINLDVFQAFASGFLSESRSALNRAEQNGLAFSGLFMTYIMAIRFCTDFLAGDQYYKTAHPKHNLQRTRAQLKLLTSMEQHLTTMNDLMMR